jgi:hypothetical protein
MLLTYACKAKDLKKKIEAMQLVFGNITLKEAMRKIKA